MNIIEVKGNVIDPNTFIKDQELIPTLVVLQQVNTMGVMGAGVALAIVNKYPEVLEQYVQYIMQHNKNSVLGHVCITYTTNPKLMVFNLFGQDAPTTERRATDYEALYCALEATAKTLKFFPNHCIAVPKYMSSGLAGGNWSIVRTMIEEVFKDLPNKLYIVEYEVKDDS